MTFTANSQQMNFKTSHLIEALECNRDTHIEEYNEALKGYKEKIRETLLSLLDKYEKGTEDYSGGFSINLIAPQSHEEEYTTVIEMLKMCTDETIMLDRSSFKNYVLDDWSWKTQFNNTTKMYNNKGV